MCHTSITIMKTAPQSQFARDNLGLLYEDGLGVVKDYRRARQLYALVSAQRSTDATANLKRLDEKIRTECPLLGKRVQIAGASRDDLNGRAGVATSFDHARGRYVVELEGKGNSRNAKLKVKPENLVQEGAKRKGKK